MKYEFYNLVRYLSLKCCRGCSEPAIGIYWLNKGCACDTRKLQWLCIQHLVKLEPIDKMKCLLKIYEIENL